jgi:hypothetical protein
MTGIAQILLTPRDAADRIRKAPSWYASAAILVVMAIGASLLLRAQVVTVTLNHLPPSATPGDREILESFFQQRLSVDLAFLPIRLLGGWVCTALLLFFLNKSWTPNNPVRFTQVFSLEVHAEAVLVLARLATAASSLIAAGTGRGIRVPFGLDAVLAPGTSALVAAALNTVNPFALWYIAVIAIGLARIGGLHPAKGWITSLIGWGVSSALNLGAIALIGERMHLRL